MLIIRSLALGEVEPADWFRVVSREWGAGSRVGRGPRTGPGSHRRAPALYYGGTAAGSAQDPGHGLSDRLAVAIALVMVVTLGTLLGSALPLLFKRLGMDPAIMSTPSIAASMDVLGLLSYFFVVKLILGI